MRIGIATKISSIFLKENGTINSSPAVDPQLRRDFPFSAARSSLEQPPSNYINAESTNGILVSGPPLEIVFKALEEYSLAKQAGKKEVSLSSLLSRNAKIGIEPVENSTSSKSDGNSGRIVATAQAFTRTVGNSYTANASFSERNNDESLFLSDTLFDQLDVIVFTHLKEKLFTGFMESVDHFILYFKYVIMSKRKIVEDDFALFRVLGRGGFGLVNGCKRATTGKLFAMKMMNKKRVKLKKSESLCLNERTTLSLVESPFVVCLRYAFLTNQDLFLILDLMQGGDLGFHLARKGRLSVLEAKYYSARTLLGIADLHAFGIVYRDLKPENILMDADGTTKLSDLGLATKIKPKGLSDVCGTRGYWAPEMIRKDANGKRERYTESVDWFSFGCCVYEFLVGVSPFRTERARTWGGMDPKKDKDKAIDQALLEMEPDFDDSLF